MDNLKRMATSELKQVLSLPVVAHIENSDNFCKDNIKFELLKRYLTKEELNKVKNFTQLAYNNFIDTLEKLSKEQLVSLICKMSDYKDYLREKYVSCLNKRDTCKRLNQRYFNYIDKVDNYRGKIKTCDGVINLTQQFILQKIKQETQAKPNTKNELSL
jgi:hypothetical protein